MAFCHWRFTRTAISCCRLGDNFASTEAITSSGRSFILIECAVGGCFFVSNTAVALDVADGDAFVASLHTSGQMSCSHILDKDASCVLFRGISVSSRGKNRPFGNFVTHCSRQPSNRMSRNYIYLSIYIYINMCMCMCCDSCMRAVCILAVCILAVCILAVFELNQISRKSHGTTMPTCFYTIFLLYFERVSSFPHKQGSVSLTQCRRPLLASFGATRAAQRRRCCCLAFQ